MNPLVFGTDPEKFAAYKMNGEYFVLPPAWFREYGKIPFVPGEKGHHVFLDAMDEMGALVMEDGVAFEYTVRPSTDWKELFDRVKFADKILSEEILSAFSKECESEVFTLPTIRYDVDRWINEGKQFQMCLIFGCDQDYNAPAFLEKDKKAKAGKVVDALVHPYRYGGGHFHISGSEAIKNEPILAVQCLQLSVGLAAVAFSDVPNLEKDRTFLYGKPRRYRIQQYKGLFDNIPNTDVGIEYRTPSNRWTNSFEHAKKMFEWAEIGIRNLLEKGLGLELLPELEENASKAIIECNQPLAHELLSYIENRI